MATDTMHATSLNPDAAHGAVPGGVVIVGAGAVGLALAIALGQSGIPTSLIGPLAPPRPGRTVALLDGSIRLLTGLGIWPALAPSTAPLQAMRLVDATDSLFRPPPVTFEATEIGLTAFGSNIENAVLEQVLRDAAETTPNLILIDDTVDDVVTSAGEASVRCASCASCAAALVVAADGRGSRLRKRAGIGVRTRTWPQVALTALLSHAVDHGNVSTEFHTREGPFTLVPLPASTGSPHRSSLVWVMRPDEAARRRALTVAELEVAIQRQSASLLGAVRIESDIGAFPIATSVSSRSIGSRLALIGEAAHALPPIGAQGMNLSLRDVQVLTRELVRARSRSDDLGSPAVLERFARARGADVALRTLGVDSLNGSLLSNRTVTDALRGAGLTALSAVGPLRRWVMRHGLAPDAPRGSA